jgi:hypothetical protein
MADTEAAAAGSTRSTPISDSNGPGPGGASRAARAGAASSGAPGADRGGRPADQASALRIPPQDIEAEMSLLGSMLLHRDAIGDVLPIIHRNESDRFYQPAHRRLFEVLVDMYDRGDPVDLVTLRPAGARQGDAAGSDRRRR